MPVLWRYLLRQYFQVFLLCVCSFIAVLLVTRFQEIARFASSGASIGTLSLFVLYQIPYVLPFAIPISCLIAAMLLFQKLSHTHELTAFRACGLGIKWISFPLIFAGIFLSMINFSIASELAPKCRAYSKELIYEMTNVNPLFLLQKESMVRLKNSYFDMKRLKSGKYAEDVILIMKNHSNQRLGVMTARELHLNGELLAGKEVTFISSLDSKKTDHFDHLIIENQASMHTKASNLSQFLQSSDWSDSYDYYPLKTILAKRSLDTKKSLLSFGRAQSEIARRVSIALAAFTFTFIGISFGMEIGRNRTKKGIFWAFGLASFFLICFISAKSIRHAPMLATIAYLLPHPLIFFLSLRFLKSQSRGVE